MVSTVTTATVSILSTDGLTALLGLIIVGTLFILLAQKEIIGVSELPRLQALNRFLNVAITPMIMIFFMLIVTNIVENVR